MEIEELRTEANELGINFPKNTGAVKLQEKIDAHYESQETSGKELEKAIAAVEQSEEKSAEKNKPVKAVVNSIGAQIHAAKAAANVTKVVTIIDNDQRVNNQTTSCKVNCSNMHFDLGQVTLPLNMAVEVRQGHLDTLKEVRIPQHVKDNVSGLSTVRMIPRYTISLEATKA
jgi:hypothetical protein